MIDKKVIPFEIVSPKELQKALASWNSTDGTKLAELRVFGSTIHSWLFSFPKCSRKNLETGLKFDASEIFSVKPAQVEIAYHVLNRGDSKIQGICSAMKKQDVLAYLKCFQKSPLLPLSLTALVMSSAMDIIEELAPIGGEHCVINFVRPEVVNITVFANHQPVLLRELKDVSHDDLENKIHDTIRYAQSHSQSKQINHIYFTGNLKGKEDIVKNIKALEVPVTNVSMKSPSFEVPNLLNYYALNPRERFMFIKTGIVVLIASVIAGMLLGWHFFNVQMQIKKARQMFNVNEYQRALDLQEQLRQVGHAQ